MAVLSSKYRLPFLTYLTVFRSRLGLANVLLPMSGTDHAPEAVLLRKLKATLDDRVFLELADANTSRVIEYLLEKRVIGDEPRSKGRYAGWSIKRSSDGAFRVQGPGSDGPQAVLPVYRTDVWMSDERVASTVGVPTADNAREVLELCEQLRLIDLGKGTWTAAGQLANRLRIRRPTSSPFVLGAELTALLRQVLSVDGILLRPLMDRLPSRFSRDEAVALFPQAVVAAAERCAELRLAPATARELRAFVQSITATTTKNSAAVARPTAGTGRRRPAKSEAYGAPKGPGSSAEDADESAPRHPGRGPGVLEHRTAPRLEWLVDVGALSKAGQTRNLFQYEQTDDFARLATALSRHPSDSTSATLEYWHTSDKCKEEREHWEPLPARQAITAGYRAMRRQIGPASIAEVLFVAGLHCHAESQSQLRQELVSWAEEDRRVTLSGGRFSKALESVHMRDSLFPTVNGE